MRAQSPGRRSPGPEMRAQSPGRRSPGTGSQPHRSFRSSGYGGSGDASSVISGRSSSASRMRPRSAPRIRQSSTFSSGTPRFKRTDAAAVGVYTPRVTARGQKSSMSMSGDGEAKEATAPFGSWRPRGTPNTLAARAKTESPGPGHYTPIVRRNGRSTEVSAPDELNASRSGSLLNSLSHHSNGGGRASSPFLSRAKRLPDPGENAHGVRMSRAQTPGAGSYYGPTSDFDKVRSQWHPLGDSAAFRSDSFARTTPGSKEPGPGPGTYDPRALRDGIEPNVGSLGGGRSKIQSPMFRSRSPARPPPNPARTTPGPGSYDVKHDRFGARRELAESAYELGYERYGDEVEAWSYFEG
ncbi:hypothetical protein T492DRAFT_1029645 [Pavlovales sp. CCMP2436]|nr:hypothetical protein T492DRAFT_1029645 [Pavlovales sp. CCMP2436]